MASRGKPKAEEPESARSLVAMARGLAEIVAEHNLSELIVDTKELTLTVRRGGAMTQTAGVMQAMPLPAAGGPGSSAASSTGPGAAGAGADPGTNADDKLHLVTSPFVGTFYRRPNPDSPNYVAVHDKVDKGQVLCIVEAMKLMNEIEADVAGTIVAILVDDGAPVEYGQTLFRIAAA
jgi:acetyl-CoA carboxylase biotin carboxyl carrier protein